MGVILTKLVYGKAFHIRSSLSTKAYWALKQAKLRFLIARIMKALSFVIHQEFHILSFIRESDILILSTNNGISHKRTKNQSKRDNTGHGMESVWRQAYQMQSSSIPKAIRWLRLSPKKSRKSKAGFVLDSLTQLHIFVFALQKKHKLQEDSRIINRTSLFLVGTVAYRLELPEKLSRVHSTFHVSNLKKCLSDEPLAIPLDEIHIDEKLHFIEEPVEIMDREVKRLKQSRIPIVKVRWNSKRGPEYTWEREDQMQKKYPHLFANPTSASQATS
ncbi:hypothetical protein Tco_0058485 [Tanacetum coccineum]